MDALLTVHQLSKSFPGVKALDRVQFHLEAGEVHALMGENGAGKSTLMKILAGVHTKDSGDIRMHGREVDIRHPADAQALAIGIIHQELALMEHLTVAQNMFLGREPRMAGGLWLNEKKLNQEAQRWLDQCHVPLNPRTRVGDLTVGRQQMVEIVKALTHRSRVLIMDEPTAALNLAEVEELFRMIRKLKAEGVGIVYISHKMDEIQQIADRITVLRDGAYVGTVPAHTPMNDIITMMVGRPLSAWQKTVPDVANQPVALEVSGLSRGRAVQSVSLRVRRGEILGLAGLMGAGRTEVARIIFGADKMDAGEVRVNGRSVCLRTPRDAVRAGVGFVSEDRKRFGLVTGMDVQSNITLPSLARWLRWRLFLRPAAIRRVATEMTQQLGIKTPSLTQKVKLLSGGNQQKVVIAKWLVQQSEVLIFDEPTRGIDVGAKQEIYKLINELAAQGRAIILISSELPEILQISHRIAVMCEGRLTGELDAREATQENVMALATQRTV